MANKFEVCLSFLLNHSGVYNFQLTKIFLENPLDAIPSEWLQFLTNLKYEDLSEIPFAPKKHQWPDSLIEFVIKANELSLNRNINTTDQLEAILDESPDVVLSAEDKRGMNPKKCHEVIRLTSLVNKCCKKFACHHIIDVGSGLGYLGQILNTKYGYHVCGLESEDCRTHGAEAWIKKKGVDQNKVDTVTFFMTDVEQCHKDFSQLVKTLQTQQRTANCKINFADRKEYFNFEVESASNVSKTLHFSQLAKNNGDSCEVEISNHCDKNSCDKMSSACNCKGLNEEHKCGGQEVTLNIDSTKIPHGVCMTGLHCCGDLTPTACKFFLRCPEVKSFICLGCCYHNMSEKEASNEFNMFPLSDELKHAYSKIGVDCPLNKFALRLAAQETRTRWKSQTKEDHQYHINNVAFRGLLEVFCDRENIAVKKERRRVARRKDFRNLDTYIDAIIDRIKIEKPVDYIREKLHDLHEEFKETIQYIEAITCLQVVLQPVIESLIIMDRISYLRQHGVNAEVIPVFDENISPRNLAIVAWKS